MANEMLNEMAINMVVTALWFDIIRITKRIRGPIITRSLYEIIIIYGVNLTVPATSKALNGDYCNSVQSDAGKRVIYGGAFDKCIRYNDCSIIT